MTSIYWKGGNGRLADGSAWQGGVAPGQNDIGIIQQTGSYTISGPANIGELWIRGGDAIFTGQLETQSLQSTDFSSSEFTYLGIRVEDGGTFTVASGAYVTLDAGQGYIYPAGVPGLLVVGGVTSGQLDVLGTVAAGTTYIGEDAQGSGTVSGSAATLDAGFELWVGVHAASSLLVDAGATVAATFVNLGITQQAAGSVLTLTGTGTTLSSTQDVGIQFGGTLNVLDGASLATGTVVSIQKGSTLQLDTSASFSAPNVAIEGGLLSVGRAAGQPSTFTLSAPLALGRYGGANVLGTTGGATLDLTGTITGEFGDAGSLVIAAGDVVLSNGGNSYSDTVNPFGTIESGETDLNGGTLELAAAGAAGTGLIRFGAGAHATLAIDAGALPSNAIAGFEAGDHLLFNNLQLSGVTYAGSALTLLSNGVSVGSIDIGSGYTAGQFSVREVGGSTEVSIPCFLQGTRIATTRGEVPVEQLAPGDEVLTVEGGEAVPRPVVWVGRSRFDAAQHPRPREVVPVRIRAGALGAGLPRRDLLVSPGHSLLMGDVLVQAERLINGATIVRDEWVRRGQYFHVELDRHAILLSEGAASESYLDTGNRHAFQNGGVVAEIHPDFGPKSAAETCVPLAEHGPALVAARERLLAIARDLGWRQDGTVRCRLQAGRDVVDPATARGGWMTFDIPGGHREIRLVSPATCPAQVAGAEDERQLGLLLGAATIGTATGRREVRLTSPVFTQGWHAVERQDGGFRRWSNGDGRIALSGEACRLSLYIVRAMPSWVPPDAIEPALRLSA